MKKKPQTLVSQKLTTTTDYAKQREKDRSNFEKFVKDRKEDKEGSNKKNLE